MPWSPGRLVRHIDDPAKIGTVTDQTRPRASGVQHRVSWSGRLDWHYADELVAAESSEDDIYEMNWHKDSVRLSVTLMPSTHVS